MDATELLPALYGVATAFAVYGIGALAAVRRHSFRFEQARRAPPADPTYLPNIEAPDSIRRSPAIEDVRSRMLEEHEASNALQNRCVAALVGTSVTLLAAFAVAAAGVTIAERWHAIHLYSAALDLTALAIVGIAFVRSGRLRESWIRHRSIAEFLRQWSLTDVVFVAGPPSVTARFEAFKARAEAALARGREPDVLDAAVIFGDARLKEIRDVIASVQRIEAETLRFYLARRPIRQVRWFSGSVARIEGQHGRREITMVALFAGALLAALVKTGSLAMAQSHAVANWAAFGLLIFIGLAAASTSAYMGQNLRSLRHRYRAQLRSIEDWFADHAGIVALAESGRAIEGPEIARVAEAVSRFEGLMIVELVDWISITTDDAMELAPS